MKVALSKIPGLLVTSLVAVLGIVALSSNEARPSETSMPSVAGAAASVKPSLVHTAVHDGPLVIETTLRNTSVGTSGSFDVTQRAKMLGCTSGTFEDRLTEPAYADGESAPSGADRPNARAISNAVAAQSTDTTNVFNTTDFLWLSDEQRHGVVVEDRCARGDRPDRRRQFVSTDALEEVPGRSGSHHITDEVMFHERRERKHPDVWMCSDDLPRRLTGNAEVSNS